MIPEPHGRTVFHSGNIQTGMSFPLSEEFLTRALEEMARVVGGFFSQNTEFRFDCASIAGAVDEALNLYDRRPVEDNRGGSTFNNLFWLFVISRLLQPDLIVESGVWKGQSSFFLQAGNPEARFHAFDITLKNLVYRSDRIAYHEQDWADYSFAGEAMHRPLLFFDDHVNQARRIKEAAEKGFRYALFDDNLPFYFLYKDRAGIAPTIEMLYDEDLPDALELRWMCYGKPNTVTLDLKGWREVRKHVVHWARVPMVDPEPMSSKSVFGGPSKLAFVILKP